LIGLENPVEKAGFFTKKVFYPKAYFNGNFQAGF